MSQWYIATIGTQDRNPISSTSTIAPAHETSSKETQLSISSLLSKIYMKLPHHGSRSVELDFIRGVAILLVMGVHFQTVPTDNLLFRFLQYPGQTFGGVGVDLFFVLSGFLVGGLLMKEYKSQNSLDVRRFILRRGMKIWPAYYFFLLMEVVTHAHPLKTFLWQNLLHVQNYTGSTIRHSWSLAVEEHFYLALAFGMGWMVTRHWPPARILKLLLTVMAVVLVTRSISYFLIGASAAFEQTHNRIDSLVCGVSLALVYHFFPETFRALSRFKSILIAVTAVVVLFLCTVQAPVIRNTVGFTIIYIGAAAFLLLAYSHSSRIRGWIPYRIVATIGVYSYGIYLYHNSVRNPCMALAKHFPAAWQWPVLMLLQYSSAIVLGAVVTRIVEWPFLRYRDRILPQRVGDIGSPKKVTVEAGAVQLKSVP